MAAKRKVVDDEMTTQAKDAGAHHATAAPAMPAFSANPSQKPDSYYRNLYGNELDFRLLGKRDAEFAAL